MVFKRHRNLQESPLTPPPARKSFTLTTDTSLYAQLTRQVEQHALGIIAAEKPGDFPLLLLLPSTYVDHVQLPHRRCWRGAFVDVHVREAEGITFLLRPGVVRLVPLFLPLLPRHVAALDKKNLISFSLDIPSQPEVRYAPEVAERALSGVALLSGFPAIQIQAVSRYFPLFDIQNGESRVLSPNAIDEATYETRREAHWSRIVAALPLNLLSFVWTPQIYNDCTWYVVRYLGQVHDTEAAVLAVTAEGEDGAVASPLYVLPSFLVYTSASLHTGSRCVFSESTLASAVSATEAVKSVLSSCTFDVEGEKASVQVDVHVSSPKHESLAFQPASSL